MASGAAHTPSPRLLAASMAYQLHHTLRRVARSRRNALSVASRRPRVVSRRPACGFGGFVVDSRRWRLVSRRRRGPPLYLFGASASVSTDARLHLSSEFSRRHDRSHELTCESAHEYDRSCGIELRRLKRGVTTSLKVSQPEAIFTGGHTWGCTPSTPAPQRRK